MAEARGRARGNDDEDETTQGQGGTSDADQKATQQGAGLPAGVARPEERGTEDERVKAQREADRRAAEQVARTGQVPGTGVAGPSGGDDDDEVEGMPREEAMRRAAETTEERRGRPGPGTTTSPEPGGRYVDPYTASILARQYLGSLSHDDRRKLIDELEPVPVHDPNAPHTSAGPLIVHRADQDAWKHAEQRYVEANRRELARSMRTAPNGVIAVMTARDDDKVAFTESHDWHPHGLAYVAGQDSPPAIVARTPEVEQALLQHRIVKVDVPLPTADELEGPFQPGKPLGQQRRESDEAHQRELQARRG